MRMEEVFARENTEHLETPESEAMYRKNVLQIAWFEHRANTMNDEQLQLVLDRIKAESPEQAERINTATPEERRNILIEDMVLAPGSLAGSAERVWFREVFLKMPEAQSLLERVEEEPEEVFAEIDRLFTASHH